MRNQLDGLFRPRSIAVVGASRRKGSIGREMLHNILRSEFNGKVFPVSLRETVVNSIKAYSTILDVPDAVDLAIIIVPKMAVLEVVRQCGEKGVKGIVVISAGFSEVGPEGKAREEAVLEIVHEYGMRMIGPNCFGIVNTALDVSLNATFGKTYPQLGKIGFITQSGAMGEAIMNQAAELDIGFSIVASIGNKADISSNDILNYLKDDPNTDIILMYLENFGNPRHFTRIAREISKEKPIVVVKSGRTSLGAKAASSHTGALAGLDVGVDALFSQAGVMRVETVEELFDIAMALSAQPVPKGNKVVVVTNAGGPGILATDALINNGLEMPPLAKTVVTELKKFISEDASFSNPMDMVAGAGAKQFRKTLSAIRKDKQYHTVIPIFVPPVTIDQLEVAQSIEEALDGTDKTVLACFMGAGEGSSGIRHLKDHSIPVYVFPEAIAKLLGTLDGYRRWCNRPKEKYPDFKVDKARVIEIVEEATSQGQDTIIGEEAIEILQAYGIPAVGYQFASKAKEAATLASQIGFPVVMKIATPNLLHKTEAKGVVIDLRSDKEVREAFAQLKARAGRLKKGERFSVAMQEMIVGAVETVIGMSTDPSFGPLIMFGLGGIYVEVMKDVSFRIAPVSDLGAREMIESLKSYPLLTGFRGAPPIELRTIENAIMRLSNLVSDFPCFSEIDINPFIVSADKSKCQAVDARFIINH